MDPLAQTHVALAFADLAHHTADRIARAKQAAQVPDGYFGMAHQNYLPTHQRRSFSPEEEAMIAKEKKKWIPKIFTTLADSPAKDMSSPTVSAVLHGLLGGGLGGLAGAALSDGHGGATALGAGIGGLGLGALGYFGRRAGNEDIEEMMRRIPEGGTRRDMLADPILQRQNDRAAMLMAAGAGGYLSGPRSF